MPSRSETRASSDHDGRVMTLEVDGMHCASCVSTLEQALDSTPGVSEAAVNLATEQAVVTYDPHRASASDLLAAVERAGYAARRRNDGADEPQDARLRTAFGTMAFYCAERPDSSA